jgi:hypothetical protein
MYSLMILNKCLTVALSLSGSLIAQVILDVPWRRPGVIVACALSLGSLPAEVLPPMMRYDPRRGRSSSPPGRTRR